MQQGGGIVLNNKYVFIASFFIVSCLSAGKKDNSEKTFSKGITFYDSYSKKKILDFEARIVDRREAYNQDIFIDSIGRPIKPDKFGVIQIKPEEKISQPDLYINTKSSLYHPYDMPIRFKLNEFHSFDTSIFVKPFSKIEILYKSYSFDSITIGYKIFNSILNSEQLKNNFKKVFHIRENEMEEVRIKAYKKDGSLIRLQRKFKFIYKKNYKIYIEENKIRYEVIAITD